MPVGELGMLMLRCARASERVTNIWDVPSYGPAVRLSLYTKGMSTSSAHIAVLLCGCDSVELIQVTV